MIYGFVETPLGRLLVLVDDGAVVGVGFLDGAHALDALGEYAPDASLIQQTRSELDGYFSGVRRTFTVPTRLDGSPFALRVWAALRRIPYGETTTYGAIAKEIGSPKAAQAVGQCVGRNPIAVIVPCHRVIGADGSLTGYAGGLHRKEALLALEHRNN